MEENTRTVHIAGDADGNVVITGDSNSVFIIHATQPIEPEAKPTQTLGPNPYKGLGAFQEEDANFFFGREELTQELWTKFRDLHTPHENQYRILPILGPSGSGKSSVARAGLLPELARRAYSDRKSVRVAVFSPGAHPLESLATILARVSVKEPMAVAKIREFEQELKLKSDNNTYDGLRRIAAAIPDISTTPLVILIDQFEEIYTRRDSLDKRKTPDSVDEGEIFIANILTAARDRSFHVSIILTLRSDFRETFKSEELGQIIDTHEVVVPRMTHDQLERAIAKPAEMSGHHIDPATVELLISQTDKDALPLLQFALMRIWDGMGEGVHAAETLRKLGGVGGALAHEAQRLYESLGNDADKALARRTFLTLVRVGRDIPTTRRTMPIDDLVPMGESKVHVRKILELFASRDARILTLAANAARQETAKIAHEALIEHWQQFRKWIEQSYKDLLFQYRVEDAADDWEFKKRDKRFVWRSPELDRLKEFRRNPERKLTKLQVDFADASEWEALKRLIYKIVGVTAAAVLFLSSLYYLNAYRKAQNANTAESSARNGLPQNSSPQSSPPIKKRDRYGVVMEPETMTPEQKGEFERLKQEMAYAVETLNPLFGKNLGIPNISIREDQKHFLWDFGSNTYIASLSFKDMPECTYHAISHYFTSQASNIIRDRGESGAIDQSYSDIYAEVINQRKLKQTAADADWEIAPGYEALMGIATKGPFTSMKDPQRTRQIAHIKGLVKSNDPVGGNSSIYANKGISDKAFYETATKIGTDKAAEIWTKALPKLSKNVTFRKLAGVLASEAANQYGKDSAEHTAVRDAWKVVGITVR